MRGIANFSDDGLVEVTGAGWNNSIPPMQQVDFGFCADPAFRSGIEAIIGLSMHCDQHCGHPE